MATNATAVPAVAVDVAVCIVLEIQLWEKSEVMEKQAEADI